eukprot:GHVU01084510.1.p1 GENE.GHVU01084510.1~~GHVU01084510.1.p1  ORF type:complete len:127 (-),score=5.35 GHVU01084510.1:410-790(-)
MVLTPAQEIARSSWPFFSLPAGECLSCLVFLTDVEVSFLNNSPKTSVTAKQGQTGSDFDEDLEKQFPDNTFLVREDSSEAPYRHLRFLDSVDNVKSVLGVSNEGRAYNRTCRASTCLSHNTIPSAL